VTLVLDYLTTDPAFWRRGIASMLVQSGLKVGDQYGIKVYVMSEPASLKLYLNHGFELLETVSTDYSKYGGTEPTVEHFLVRVPRSIV
jgi:GNAT superfamily N-acetyltransferase